MSALHWEALRKQRVVDKKHEWEQKYKEELKKLIEQHRKEFEASSQNPNDSSYEKQLNALLGRNGVCPRGQYHRSIDEERRREIQEAAIKDFSAKMSRRYNDTDFAQLW